MLLHVVSFNMPCLRVIFYFFTFIWLFTNCQQLIQVQQEPKDMVIFPGSSLKVSCSISGTSNPDLFWYHWNETAGFILIFTSRSAGMVDPTSYNEFKSSRPKDLQMILESDGVSEIRSAVWYCAASPHSIPVSSESCTKTSRIRTWFKLPVLCTLNQQNMTMINSEEV